MLVTKEIMAKMKNMVIIATILLPFAADAPCAFTFEAIVLKRIGLVYMSYLDSRIFSGPYGRFECKVNKYFVNGSILGP